MSIRRSVSGPALVLTAGRTLAFGAAFLIPVVLARVYSVAEFGTYKQAFILSDTLYFIAQIGLATSLFYFLPRSPDNAARLVTNALLAIGLVGALCAAILVTRGELVAWLFGNPELESLVVPAAIYFLFMMLAVPLEIVMICRQRYRATAVSYALSDVTRAVALILPTVVTGELRWLMVGAVTFAGARFGATILYLRGVYGGDLRPDRSLLHEQLRYSLPFGLAVLVGTLQSNFHHLVVSHSFDAATFAIFAVGCLQIPLIDFIAVPMADVMMVKMTEARRERQLARAKEMWHQAMSDLALLFVPLVGLLLVVADSLIVLLYTDSYAASAPIFRVFILSVLFTPLLVESVLRVHADTRWIFALSTIQLGIVAGLIRPFLDRFGLVGGVLVTLIAVVVVRGLGLWRVKLLLGSGTRELLPWARLIKVAAIAAIATCAALGVKSALRAPPLPALAVIGGTHAVVWAGLSVYWGFVPAPSPLVIRTWLRRVGLRASGPGEHADAGQTLTLTDRPSEVGSRAADGSA
jgi:O-antigen/teichoic acid export membrane protein